MIVAATEALLSQGRVAEAVAIMEPVRWDELDRFTRMLVDAGHPDHAVRLLNSNAPVRNASLDRLEKACIILAEAGHRTAAIEISKAYVDEWGWRYPKASVEEYETRIRRWELEERDDRN